MRIPSRYVANFKACARFSLVAWLDAMTIVAPFAPSGQMTIKAASHMKLYSSSTIRRVRLPPPRSAFTCWGCAAPPRDTISNSASNALTYTRSVSSFASRIS